ncbi:hypothetical protein JCM16161A_09730 [Vulcanisaeta sp. JCM 16161]|uniref:hypothetical protein n=1 Tax=Vulcanisaeta sp. JCM 16161 TaxID=1295372 RepID=UPI0006D01C62|nr:hypothetical protein [Vulcanisaeta sp. JCM 16161]
MTAWEYTTLGWFKKNAVAISTDKSYLMDFVNALRQMRDINNVSVPLMRNDLQGRNLRSGPLGRIIRFIEDRTSNRFEIRRADFIPGNIVLNIISSVLGNDELWSASVPGLNTLPKVLVAELPANVRGFLNAGETSRSGLFVPPLGDIALGFLGAVLTYVNSIRDKKGDHYIYLGLSRDLWIRLGGGSAVDVLNQFNDIRRLFRTVLDRVREKRGLIIDYAFIYIAAKIRQYLPKGISIKEDIIHSNYYVDLLTLFRERRSQNFIATLDTISLNDYIAAILRSGTRSIILGMGKLLESYNELTEIKKGGRELGKDLIDVLNTITEDIIRFSSNNDCNEIAELGYVVTLFINEWHDTLRNLANSDANISGALKLLDGISSIRC